MSRSPKKSETLEIRLPFAAKTAFMEQCRRDGVTASEALRGFIESRVEPPMRRRGRGGMRRWIKAAAAAVAVLAAGATALPSVAASIDRAGFAALDSDHSGGLSLAELSAAGLTVQAGGVTLTGAGGLGPALRDELLRETFARCDLNGDGQLSFAEFRREAI